MDSASPRREKPVSVCHVSSVHPWTDNRIYFRECESLAAAGYKVRLIALESAVEAPRGATAVTALPRRSRLLRILITVPQALTIAFKSDAEVIHVHDPELVWAVPLGRVLKRKVVYDAHEDLPAQVLNKPYIPKWMRPLSKVVAHAVVRIAKNASWTVVATEAIARRFNSARTVVVHNYPPLRKQEEEGRHRTDTVVYIGGMSSIRGTAQLVQSLESQSFPSQWTLEIAGTAAPDVSALVSRAATLDSCIFHGQVPPTTARDMLLRAKVGIVPFQETEAHRESLPTKMFEYFAAGLPVVASDFPLWRGILEEWDCGLLVDQRSPNALAEAVAQYARDPQLLARHSANARRAAELKLNWEAESRVLCSAYSRVLSSDD